MTGNNSFSRAVVVVTLALMGGQAVHWLLTPTNHPDAGTFRTIAVAVQALVGFGGAVWAGRRTRTASSAR